MKEKERNEKVKKKEEEEKVRLKREQIKLKREEKNKRMAEENEKKRICKVRPINSKESTAIVNGKPHRYFDWSTSPAPTFINEQPWQS